MSVIEYALHDRRVEHIIVVGHNHCGGVAFAKRESLQPEEIMECFETKEVPDWPSPIRQWLQPLGEFAKSLGKMHVDDLMRESVREQVRKVVDLPDVQAAWWKEQGEEEGSEPKGRHLKGVHGWWYELETGKVHDLQCSVYAPGL